MRNIIRINYSNDDFYTENITEDYNIYYIEGRSEQASKRLLGAYHQLIELYSENELTIDDIRKNDEEKGLNYASYYCDLYDIGVEELNETDVEDILSDMYIEDLGGLINSYTELSVGTVGYSPWSYYITISDISHNFVNDIYHGYNIYDITLINESGEVLDSITEYIDNIKESTINSIVSDYFGCNDNLYYVKNDITSNFNKLTEEVKTITYNYVEV